MANFNDVTMTIANNCVNWICNHIEYYEFAQIFKEYYTLKFEVSENDRDFMLKHRIIQSMNIVHLCSQCFGSDMLMLGVEVEKRGEYVMKSVLIYLKDTTDNVAEFERDLNNIKMHGIHKI